MVDTVFLVRRLPLNLINKLKAIDADLEFGYNLYVTKGYSCHDESMLDLFLCSWEMISYCRLQLFREPYSQMVEEDVTTNFYWKLIYDATTKIILHQR